MGAKWGYYASFGLLVLAVIGLVLVVWRVLGPLLAGRPLSSWIRKNREQPGAEEARRLSDARNILATLAHDVLKHRLLGLVSLAQSMDTRLSDDDDPQAWEKMRQEMLRLCGARAAPHDRLWTRWSEAFSEVRRIARGRVAPPWGDSLLCETDRKLGRLRRHVRAFVAGEREDAFSPEVVRGLELNRIGNIHREVLALTEGCRPLIEPQRVVDEALSALGALVDREGAPERFDIDVLVDERFLVDAPPRLISTSLERLMDNALRLSGPDAPLAVEVSLEGDELFGDEVLVFRVRDAIEVMPSVEQFGDGLSEMRRTMAEYDCGFSFIRTPDAERFWKEARITLPVLRGDALPKSRRVLRPLRWAAPLLLMLIGLAVFSTSRILGGAPVQFAGGGEPVVEFRTQVGETLRFPLCEGGSNPSVALDLETNSCRQAGACTLESVVAALEPCGDGVETPGCPGEFVWTPTFEDGSRQGTSYELTLSCRSPGPPESSDMRRLRLVVSRTNSLPRLVSDIEVQVSAGGKTRAPVALDGTPIEVPAGAQLTFSASAWDEDGDTLRYELVSADGEERLSPPLGVQPGQPVRLELPRIDWREDGRFEALLRIHDSVGEPLVHRIQLEAGRLRAVRLQRFAMWNELTGEEVSCSGAADARLCRLIEDEGYLAEFEVWYDPLLSEVRERIFLARDKSKIEIVAVDPQGQKVSDGSVQEGQRWDVLSSIKGRRIASITLVQRPDHTRPGLRTYRFRIQMLRVEQGEPKNWTLRMSFDEASRRSISLQQELLLSIFDQSPSLLAERDFVRLYEWEQDEDLVNAEKTIKLFLAAESPLEPQLAAPTLRCSRPELAEAFEPLSMEQLSPNSWMLGVRLRRGCVEGLGGRASPLGPAGERTCRVELSTVDGSVRSSITLRVENAACGPRISTLEPLFEEPVEEGAALTWRVRIDDPDGDLRPDNVMLKGVEREHFTLSLRQEEEALGASLVGELRGPARCGLVVGGLNLEARDWTGQVAQTSVRPRVQCSPMIQTSTGETRFEVEDGERLEIPLEGTEGMAVRLQGRIGEVEEGTFTWDADCELGRGPHTVRLFGERDGTTGEPLELEISVRRCRVDLSLTELRSGQQVAENGLFLMEQDRSRRLRVDPGSARLQDLKIQIKLEPRNKELYVRELSGRGDIFDIFCKQANRMGTLVIRAEAADGAAQDYLDIKPRTVRVRCVEPGSALTRGRSSP